MRIEQSKFVHHAHHHTYHLSKKSPPSPSNIASLEHTPDIYPYPSVLGYIRISGKRQKMTKMLYISNKLSKSTQINAECMMIYLC